MSVSPVDLLNAFNQHFGQFVPDVAKSAHEDVQQQAKAAFSSIISKLDLVTREEFDVQLEVLRRTREKLDSLEKRVVELEAALQAKSEQGEQA
ncbi:accessory factor UbiK family protein [Hahella sp. HN01]|uniref:accessory factor UbiK family protein n=1 Tax=unclassified Hahella TaxID=2624107 RepID=UPI001C1EA04E|nr:accessory factor UbiK family protein [Hahella sp. HN01]MBU6952693.1 accessory factor UbiK family protein [Hahella sp. HN01]